jgi:aerobic-type carbon monoxide dehydrogenase small subunit (CoxS/CutS family)
MKPVATSFEVNGVPHPLEQVPDEERLLDTLRWRLKLKGTKEGCRTGDCGSCTVLVRGRSTLSCLTLTREVAEHPITTIEGIERVGEGRRVAHAFTSAAAVQCGYCTPGFVVALTGLLAERPAASAEELLSELQGNLCRCTGYASIARAVRALRNEGP